MAILYGTTADGESLPVEVNEFGQLIAQGLQGQAGPPGQPGPPGPPGVGELPPDPYEGAVLGWKDNQLSWIGGSVPLPEGTYGPILDYSDGALALETPVDLPYLTSIFLSDALGNRYSYTPVTSQISAVENTYVGDLYFSDTAYGTNGPGTIAATKDFAGISMAPWFNPALDDIAKTGSDNSGNAGILVTDTGPTNYVELNWSVAEIGDTFEIVWGGISNSSSVIVNGDIAESGTTYTSLTGKPDLPKSVFTVTATATSGSFRLTSTAGYVFVYYVTPPASLLSLSDNTNLDQFRVGDFVQQDSSQFSDPTAEAVKILAIDSSAPSLTTDFSGWNVGSTVVGPIKSGDGTVQSTVGNAIVLRANNDEWIVGQYVTAPAQSLAARLLYKDQLKEAMQ